jgi:hypothetical protein
VTESEAVRLHWAISAATIVGLLEKDSAAAEVRRLETLKQTTRNGAQFIKTHTTLE